MRRVAVYWVPYHLTREQRDYCMEICREWLKRIEDEPDVMGCLIRGGEETVKLMHKAYTEEWLGHSTILHWHKAFPEGRETTALLILHEKLKMQESHSLRGSHSLTREQRDHCTESCRKWLKRIEHEPDVMRRVITGGESGFTTLIQLQNRKAYIGSLCSLQ